MTDYNTTSSSSYLTIKETAKRFNVSDSWIRKMIREGRLRHYRAGKKILIQPKDLEDALIVVEPFQEIVEDYL